MNHDPSNPSHCRGLTPPGPVIGFAKLAAYVSRMTVRPNQRSRSETQIRDPICLHGRRQNWAVKVWKDASIETSSFAGSSGYHALSREQNRMLRNADSHAMYPHRSPCPHSPRTGREHSTSLVKLLRSFTFYIIIYTKKWRPSLSHGSEARMYLHQRSGATSPKPGPQPAPLVLQTRVPCCTSAYHTSLIPFS
eukprot:scaffold108544_cov18-Tisochrysis_lutea.AAC.2